MTTIPEDIRAILKLPPLTMYQKGKTVNRTQDIRSTFERISKLHRLLPDPLRDVLCSFTSEEDLRENNEFPVFEKILKVKKLPNEIYKITAPNHMPFWRRYMSNKIFEANREFIFRKRPLQGIIMSAVVVRWLERNLRPSLTQEMVTEVLLVFGPIESVTSMGQRSALIIFENIISASRAVSAFPHDGILNRIKCIWFYKYMAKDRKYKCGGKRVVIKIEDVNPQ
ncbi:testis expressed protein 56 [Monodelphis domestica]|uniref:Uncharacterized protein n=1 Tax=Monodelphis domestica TaxID=13616 RepID=A0A5F8HIJ4_MONDO|nr:testis expressed protein 56 [Monodelphis domestica]